MKIILTQEVSGLGTPGDIVEVKDGYGRNYLLPQGFAIRVDQGRGEAGRGHQAGPRRPARSATWATPTRSRPSSSGLKVTLTARAGDGGRLFGSITPAEIVDAVKAAGGPVAGPAPPRAARPHQDHGRVQGAGQAAPRGDRHVPGERGRRQVTRIAERRVGLRTGAPSVFVLSGPGTACARQITAIRSAVRQLRELPVMAEDSTVASPPPITAAARPTLAAFQEPLAHAGRPPPPCSARATGRTAAPPPAGCPVRAPAGCRSARACRGRRSTTGTPYQMTV